MKDKPNQNITQEQRPCNTEALDLVRHTERQIADLLRELQTETGINIDSLDINSVSYTTMGSPKIVQVINSVSIRLRVTL